jgi:hypothetical protein
MDGVLVLAVTYKVVVVPEPGVEKVASVPVGTPALQLTASFQLASPEVEPLHVSVAKTGVKPTLRNVRTTR